MIAAILLAQITTLAGPRLQSDPATGWKCRYKTLSGEMFELSGLFPEFPKGSPTNSPVATVVMGNGPAVFLGQKPVDAFTPRRGHRVYQISFTVQSGDRYNLNFEFASKGETSVNITHWQSKEQRLVTYANGRCLADFDPSRPKP